LNLIAVRVRIGIIRVTVIPTVCVRVIGVWVSPATQTYIKARAPIVTTASVVITTASIVITAATIIAAAVAAYDASTITTRNSAADPTTHSAADMSATARASTAPSLAECRRKQDGRKQGCEKC
jgi:hypothetical protein